LILPSQVGEGAVLYSVVKSSEGEYELGVTMLSSIDASSPLLVRLDAVERLQSANLYVIVSSLSGAGLASTAFERLLAPLLKVTSIEPTVHWTTSKTSHIEFIEKATFDPAKENIIVIFGGDTIVYHVLNSLPKNRYLTGSNQITLCVVPCGTGNAFVTSLGLRTIPDGIMPLFGISSTGQLNRPLPLLKVTIQEDSVERVIWSAVVCSWGLHSSLVADSDSLEMRREHGPNRFRVRFLRWN
jgi:diacylglycerol kinase family enzyme